MTEKEEFDNLVNKGLIIPDKRGQPRGKMDIGREKLRNLIYISMYGMCWTPQSPSLRDYINRVKFLL